MRIDKNTRGKARQVSPFLKLLRATDWLANECRGVGNIRPYGRGAITFELGQWRYYSQPFLMQVVAKKFSHSNFSRSDIKEIVSGALKLYQWHGRKPEFVQFIRIVEECR